MAVLPSPEIATAAPCLASPMASVPTSLPPCCDHTPPLRVKTHAAPWEPSSGPPTIAVLPSAEIATELPCRAAPTAPAPTSLVPCCDHTPALRVKIHAAPVAPLSVGPPTMAVFPSAEIATEAPIWAAPATSVPTSLLPCWTNCAAAPCARTNIPRTKPACRVMVNSSRSYRCMATVVGSLVRLSITEAKANTPDPDCTVTLA